MLRFTAHARKEMLADGISVADIEHVLANGRVIRTYPEDRPYESRLVLGYVQAQPIHIVAADAPEYTIIVTTYRPDSALWDADYKMRRKK